jgi:hypothetical protein
MLHGNAFSNTPFTLHWSMKDDEVNDHLIVIPPIKKSKNPTNSKFITYIISNRADLQLHSKSANFKEVNSDGEVRNVGRGIAWLPHLHILDESRPYLRHSMT